VKRVQSRPQTKERKWHSVIDTGIHHGNGSRRNGERSRETLALTATAVKWGAMHACMHGSIEGWHGMQRAPNHFQALFFFLFIMGVNQKGS
jgi:hypothetical protein